jgi:hypothetical protein
MVTDLGVRHLWNITVEGEVGSRRHSVCRLLESHWLEVWSLELVQRWGGGIHMNKGRVGEDRGNKKTDGCPLTLTFSLTPYHPLCSRCSYCDHYGHSHMM